jgi:hypothetical protein
MLNYLSDSVRGLKQATASAVRFLPPFRVGGSLLDPAPTAQREADYSVRVPLRRKTPNARAPNSSVVAGSFQTHAIIQAGRARLLEIERSLERYCSCSVLM